MTMMGNGWGMGLAGLGSLLLLAAVAAGAVLLGLYVTRTLGRARGHHPDPDEVLAARFARGDIDEQEYRRRLAVLEEQDAAHDGAAGEPDRRAVGERGMT
jgi:putative membrane protein